MDNFTATMLCEGQFDVAGYDESEVTEELVIEAWQFIIDNGFVWRLQGSFGRTANELIKSGVCNG